MRLTLLIAALALTSQAALACPQPAPPNCQCDTTTNTWITNNTTNNTVNGINGNVSAASNASATGGKATATGGSVNNSGNSSSTSSSSIAKGAVTNTNNVSGGQGGAGGAGGSATIAAGAVTNTVSGGSASIAAGAVTNSVSASTGASTSSATANGNGSGNGNGNSVTTNYQAAKIPVATAYSASLTSGMDTCLGSFSAGGQTQVLGITFGKTVRDKGCDLIKQTHLLLELNQQRAACVRATLGEEGKLIREAMKEAGAECPPLQVPVSEVIVTAPTDAVTHEELAEVEHRIVTHVVQK